MKIVTIRPVKEPKSFTGLKFTGEEYRSAVNLGPLKLDYASALENVKLSKGLYEIAPERDPLEVEVKAAKDPDDMTSQELVAEMTAFGKPPRKRIERKDAVAFIRKLREEAAAMIVDDDE